MLVEKIMMLGLAHGFACSSHARLAREKTCSLHPYWKGQGFVIIWNTLCITSCYLLLANWQLFVNKLSSCFLCHLLWQKTRYFCLRMYELRNQSFEEVLFFPLAAQVTDLWFHPGNLCSQLLDHDNITTLHLGAQTWNKQISRCCYFWGLFGSVNVSE